MTSVAPDKHQLQELEAGTRDAWSTYSDRLRELTGEEYERVEAECWAQLQEELQRIEREREALAGSPA